MNYCRYPPDRQWCPQLVKNGREKDGAHCPGLPLSSIEHSPFLHHSGVEHCPTTTEWQRSSAILNPPTLAGCCPAGRPSWDRLTLENPPRGATLTLPSRLENARPTWIYSIKGGHLGFRFFTPPRSSDLLKHWHYFHEMATKLSP